MKQQKVCLYLKNQEMGEKFGLVFLREKMQWGFWVKINSKKAEKNIFQ